MEKKKPIQTIKEGRVRASIWENQSKNGPFLSVTLDRWYKDGEQIKSTGSFSYTDLLNLAKVISKASAEMIDREKIAA